MINHEQAIEKLNKMYDLIPTMKSIIASASKWEFGDVRYNPFDGSFGAIQFDIKSVIDLPTVSDIICEVIPEYRYKHQMSWNGYGECLISQWGDVNYPYVIIRLEATIETWPKELTKGDGCKWVKSESVETHYNLVCDLSSAES